MIDVVYVLGTGSAHADVELLHSMRSVKKHLHNVRAIVVVGSIPRCGDLPGHEFIHLEDPGKCSQFNSMHKTLTAARTPGITDEFLLMNDDFFFTADTDAETFPHYSMGGLEPHIKWREDHPSAYGRSLKETFRQLKERGQTLIDFEIHAPIRYTKRGLLRTVSEFDWSPEIKPLLRSLYGNLLKVTEVRKGDCKMAEPNTRENIERRLVGRNYFSIGDGALAGGDVLSFLKEKYP